ncbi:hypothetical protein CF642_39330, partial [Burkholderia pseudomallei]
MAIAAAFFAGVAGALTRNAVAVATAESVGVLREGEGRFATVTGGRAGWFASSAGRVLHEFCRAYQSS